MYPFSNTPMENLPISFVYGLVFFSLGLAAALKYTKSSQTKLTGSLPFLAGFGFTHAVHEWMQFFLTAAGDMPSGKILALKLTGIVFVAASFLFLFQFGMHLYLQVNGRHTKFGMLPAGFFVIWAAAFVYLSLFEGESAVREGEVLARYLLGFPSALLSARALILHSRDDVAQRAPQIKGHLLKAGIFFAIYGVLAGLVVPKAQYFPASLVNYDSFFSTFNLPAPAFRTFCAVGIAYHIIRALDAFDIETRTRLDSRVLQVQAYAEQLSEKTRELLLLQSINNMLNAGASLEGILHAITRGIVSVFSYDSCAVHLLSEDKSALVCKGYYMDSELVRRVEALAGVSAINYVTPLHEGNPLLQVVRTREPFITSDIPALIKNHTTDKRLRMLAEPIARIFGTRWGIGVCLLAGDKVVGIIGVGSKSELRKEDARRLASFASQVGLAVEKASLEKELKAYSEELEKKVEEKTKQLIQSEKLASLGQLAAGVAHEINNPLTNIMLDAEALQRKGLRDTAAEKRVEEIISQAEAVKRIVKNLLEFSRRAEPVMDIVDAANLIDKTLLILLHQLKSVEVEKKCESALKIKGDFNQLQQVLLNVMLNAVQAMEGEGRLGITASSDGEFAEIEISDTGAGMPEENLSRIFEPFFTTKRMGEGTGLGLYIARDIVERHKGDIKVESKVGVGTRFKIKLPRA